MDLRRNDDERAVREQHDQLRRHLLAVYDGNRVQYMALYPAQSYAQQTFLTHPWLVTSASGSALGVYLPIAAPGRVTVHG